MRDLLIFDLDETLFHTRHIPLFSSRFRLQLWQGIADYTQLDRLSPDAELEDEYYRYACYKRPGFDEFFSKLEVLNFDFAVWTSSTSEYAKFFIHHLFPQNIVQKLLFVWTRSDCTVKKRFFRRDFVYIKDLSKVVAEYSYPLEKIRIVDDSPEKLPYHPHNLIRIKPWLGDLQDVALVELYQYLLQLQTNKPQSLAKKRWHQKK